jgi:raffinose/stachyose/melibiose transport system permease protein
MSQNRAALQFNFYVNDERWGRMFVRTCPYALRSFEYPFIMTGGGPANSSITLSLYIYRQMITANQYGLAMAAGLVTILIGVVFVAGVFWALQRAER